MSAPRILALAPQPFFQARGTPYSVYYRSLTMAELGARIDLLTYGEGDDVDLPGVRHLRLPHPPFLPPVPIGPSRSKLLLDLVMIAVFLRSLFTNSYDVVHAHEESVFFAALFKPLFGYRLVYDMHSSLPQQLRNFRFSRSHVLIGVFERLERFSLERADVVVTVCPALASYAEGVMTEPGRQIMIENSRFEPIRTAAPESANGQDVEETEEADASVDFPAGRRIIFYAGSFEAYQGLDLLVEAFADLRRTHDDVVLVAAGGHDGQVEALRGVARRFEVLDGCLFPGSLPQREVRRLLPRADVLVSSRVTGTNTPLKIYEQLASGVPLVATSIVAHTQVLDDSIAFLVDPSPAALADGLRAALDDPAEARSRATAARERSERDHSLAAFRRKTAELMDRLR
jgi:glycosyltransferase involved in cell wall biosynthesis